MDKKKNYLRLKWVKKILKAKMGKTKILRLKWVKKLLEAKWGKKLLQVKMS